MFDAVLKTPFRLNEASASRQSRSCADLSTPVMSCSATGVLMPNSVTSFVMVSGEPEPLSMVTVAPRPLILAIGYPFLSWSSSRVT